MNTQLSQSNQISPFFLRLGLMLVLLATGAGVYSSLRWVYRRVHDSLGLEIAEVVMAFLAIIILGLVLTGFCAGFGAKRVVSNRPEKVFRICRSLGMHRLMEPVLGDTPTPAEANRSACDAESITVPVARNRTPRRGRPPTYSIDRWIKVVSAWENRDLWRNPITLEQFLSEEFGTCADGSPRISKKTFYDWQKKVREELEKNSFSSN